jgi:hypothetical protein
MKSKLLAPVFAAGVAISIFAAPIASAASLGESCGGIGGGSTCLAPGNVQIDDAHPPVQFFPSHTG